MGFIPFGGAGFSEPSRVFFSFRDLLKQMPSLKLTASLPLKIGVYPKRKGWLSYQQFSGGAEANSLHLPVCWLEKTSKNVCSLTGSDFC